MITFNLPNDYYIRRYDSKNWILAKKLIAKKSKRENEYITGYYPKLAFAHNAAVELLCLKATDLTELNKVLSEMKEVKITIIKHEN